MSEATITDPTMATSLPTAGAPCDCHHAAPSSYGLTRRRLLGAAGAAAALGVVGAAVGETANTRLAFAANGWTGDVMVVLSLRGGFDGLSAVVPFADPAYVSMRPNIGIPASKAIPLDGTFGLHPALAPLKALWDAGQLGMVHAAGQPDPTRSHFDAMEEMERAAPGSAVRTGWLDRVSAAQGAGGAFATVAMGSDTNQAQFIGASPELFMSSVGNFSLSGTINEDDRIRWRNALATMHAGARPEIATPARLTLGALDTAAVLRDTDYVPANGAEYPGGDLGDALKDIARLIKASVGLRVATVDYGDWDMHSGLGRVDGGWMTSKLEELGKALAAFATDLGPALANVNLVTLSEFGRRLEENASGGLDHGHGNVMFLLGGGIIGGRMHGAWPGLTDGALDQGDLAATNDYRAVLAEVLEKRSGVAGASVFPGLSAGRIGFARPR